MNNTLVKSVFQKFPTNHTDWIIGVSGGVDSIVLLDLCIEFCKNNNKKIRLYPVHLNHLTRGVDSDNDEKLCSKICKSYNLNLTSAKINIIKYAKENSLNFEEAARIQRHKLFLETIKKNNLNNSVILLAHHLDDKIETILMRLQRKSGLRGLSGIKVKSKLPEYPNYTDNISVIRPLLKFKKNQLIEYAKNKRLTWREDKSNGDINYTRNLLRNITIPCLKQLDKNLYNNLEKISDLSNKAEELITKKLDSINYSTKSLHTFIDAESSKKISAIIFIRLVEKICSKFYADFLLPHKAYDQLKKLHSGAITATDIALDLHIYLYNNRFYIYKKNEKSSMINYTSNPNQFFYENKFFSLSIKREILNGKIFSQNNSNIEYVPITFENYEFNLKLPKTEELITPLGLEGHQKISKLFKNHKTPVHIRNKIPILYCNNVPIWVLGISLCNDAKLTNFTGEVFCLEYSEKTL